jgi:hypothetical protein
MNEVTVMYFGPYFGQTQPPVIRRPLGALEKLFWLADQNRPMHFAIAAEVGGSTGIEQWQRALDHVCDQSALIWSRIIRDDRDVPIFSPVTRASIPLHVVKNAAPAWTDYVAGELAQPFDSARPPLLRATLLHDPDRSVIILSVHHSIADGLALSYLMRDVLRAYAGESVRLSTETAAVERLIATGRNTATMPDVHGSQPARPPMPYRPLNGAPRVEALRLGRTMTRSLRERTRAERTSLHGALCAAVASAASKLVPGWSDIPLRVLSPIDVRGRMLNGSEHFGLCVTGAVVEDERSTHDFWTRARSFADRLKPIANAEGISTRFEMLQRGVSRISTVREAQEFFAQRFSAEILLTNLGAAVFEDTYGSMTLDALWGPAIPSAFAGGQTVGAVTVRDQLHLLHTSYGPTNLLGKIFAILNAALEDVPGRAPQAGVRKAAAGTVS